MRSGAIAFARRGERRAAPDAGEGQVLGAQRTALALFTVARAVTGVVILLLAALAERPNTVVLGAIGLLAAAELAASSAWLWRTDNPGRSRWTILALAVDLALWLAACAASGGHHSDALLLYVLLPTIAALMMDAVPLLLLAIAVGAARPLLGGDLAELTVFWIIGVWATGTAIAASHGRAVFRRRLAGLDAVWATLAVGGGPSEAVRERVADELRVTALEPIRAIREAVKASSSPEALEALVERMRNAVTHIRTIAYELYAPPGLHGGVEESLHHLAKRRSASADVHVDIQGDLPETLAKPLDAVVRDALGLVAGARTREVRITVVSSPTSAEIEIVATPGTTLDDRRLEVRRAALSARAGVDPIELERHPDGGARIATRLFGVSAPDPRDRRLQGVAFRETGGYIATVRLTLIPVTLGVPLIVGGTDPGYFWLAGVISAYLVATAGIFRRPRPDLAYLITIALDCSLLVAAFALAGDAQVALLPVAILLPVTNAATFPWGLVLPLTFFTAVLLPMVSSMPQPTFSIALAWAAIIGAVEIDSRSRQASRFFAASTRRNQLLQGLLRTEDAERRRLAERLHDDVLQLLFVARQDLVEASEGTHGAIERAEDALDTALTRLTQTVSDLDVDEGAAAVAGGLRGALETTTMTRGGPTPVIDVAPEATGHHDGLVVQLARELYANVVQHAHASDARIRVSCQPHAIVLDVSDDGVGFDFDGVEEVVADGLLGLATVRDRIRAHGGSLHLGPSEWGGTHVRVQLPVEP